MLKKVILGIVCFIVVGITGLGIYVYTLDWNKQKALVAERFSQITGLKATIEGNLTVELFPTPKFSAQSVKFSKGNPRNPLVSVSEISANVELMPMFSNKFILSSMSLNGANVALDISEKGEFNWDGVGSSGKNKSGNIEVSFNDIRMSNSSISFNNKKTGDKFELPNISSNINAKSLEGPYQIKGKFIHNGSEIGFNGDIAKNKDTVVRLSIYNAATSSKLSIDGTFGKKAKGNISFDSKSFYDIVSVVLGENKISETYDQSLLLSFVYNYENKQTKLDNFTFKYGNNIAGSGVANIKKSDKWLIDTDLDLISFDLELLESLAKDVIAQVSKTDENAKEQNSTNKYEANINIKSNHAKYKNADAQKLMIGAKFVNNVLNVDRFSIVMPGETHIKAVGKINFEPKIEYIFNQTIDSKDARIFASVFGLDIAKYASLNNKKSIFKRLQAELMASGDLNSMKITIPQAVLDVSEFSGNLGFIFNKEKPVVLVQAEASKVVFDKYFQLNNPDLKNASMEEKVVYQFNMAPWKGKFETDATIKIGNAVFNSVVIDNLDLQFVANDGNIDVKKLHSTSLGGAEVDIKLSANNVYTKPYFNELSYSVKTNNLPLLTKSLGIDTGNKGLFKRKLFAAQGVIAGSLDKYSLSSIQKFGDVEFSYTGDVSLTDKNENKVKGSIELKANNFSQFIKALGIDYSPDIPITTFTLMGTIDGSYNNFTMSDLSAYLGTNHITGKFGFDNQTKPTLVADVNFDKFDINRMFNIKKAQTDINKKAEVDFIAKPNFDDKKIDLSSLTKVNFDINTSIKHLVLNGDNFNKANITGKLNDGVLDISKFEAFRDDSKIVFDAKVNSNNIAKIEGNFNLAGIKARNVGGNVYRIENSIVDIEGNFNSLLQSKKDFFENLNSKGRFKVYGTTITGWDLDIIKFELEQRKSLNGFNDSIFNSLKTGKSNFSEISGRYEITKGIVVADNVSWNSPVITMNMGLELNLSNWKFNSTFNAFYKNASFSDVLKFSLFGELDSPEIQSDLSESIERIASIEENVEKQRANKEKEKNANIKKKTDVLISNIKIAQQNIKRMSLDVARYKPTTSNVDVVKVYENNIKDLKLAEDKLNELEKNIKNANDEKLLMDLEATLAKETARFSFIPKLLEENYIVDSKYAFDEVFNKITWLFNLAQNNSSYYNSLTEVYMNQIELLNSTDTPVDEEIVNSIKNDMNTIAMDVEKINKLHSKIRDNYLDIIDTTSITRMKENNGIAEQALSTMFVYVKQLNNSLINSIDVFRAALSIKAKDYDLYMVYPPERIADIDISLPTTKNGEKADKKTTIDKTTSASQNITDTDSSKKKDNLAFSLENLSKGISSLMTKLDNRKKTVAISDMEFSGVSNAIKVTQNNNSKAKEINVAKLKIEAPLVEVVEKSSENKQTDKVDIKPIEAENKPLENKKEIIIAEAKTQELPDFDVKVEEVLDAVKPLEETKIDTLKTETKTIANNLINKTKSLISDFVSKFTKEKTKEIEVASAENIKLPEIKNEEIDIVDNKEPVKDTKEEIVEDKSNVSNLRVNPVIAMNIGENDNVLNEVKIPNLAEKKKGFEKKNIVENIVVAEADKVETSSKENKTESGDISKGDFLEMFVLAENITPNNIETITEVDEYEENKDFEEAKNKYVNKASSNVQYFNGNIGKSFSSKEIKDNVILRNKKYLFKPKYQKLAKLDGNIGKKFALSVK